jgi:Tol biopolymer transport system component
MKYRRASALAAVVLAVSIAAAQRNQSPDVQLKAAEHKELVEGDLKGAIELYRKVVSHPDASRDAVARALLQIGLCYEKLGSREARDVYQQLIDRFPEQSREVAVARKRLEALAKLLAEVARKPRFRKIEVPTILFSGSFLSPDGKSLAFTDVSVWVMPVHGKVDPDIAGVPVRLTEPMNASSVVWSGDGKWIAFTASGGICVIPSGGGAATRVTAPEGFEPGGEDPYDARLSLSPDGKTLAYRSKKSDGLDVIPVAGGAATRIAGGNATQPAFSPDGKKIAYVTEERTLTKKVDGTTEVKVQGRVWVKALDRESPVLVSDEPGYTRGPIWSPKGEMIAFLHGPINDSASTELWIVPVDKDGRPTAPSTRFELPARTFHLLAGWTPEDRIGLLIDTPEHEAIYTVPASGERAAQVSPKGWGAAHPRWSPDGQRIYFRWNAGEIASVAADGGPIVKVLPRSKRVLPVVPGSGNDPSPDGKQIVFAGPARKPRAAWNLWTVPAGGGEPVQVTDFTGSPNGGAFPCWSPDGKAIAFVGRDAADELRLPNIYVLSLNGGGVRRLTSASDKVSWACIAWSPDGQSIAYFSRDRTLNLVPVAGGSSRVVVSLGSPIDRLPFVRAELRHHEMAWSPDSKKLAFTGGRNIGVVTLADGTVKGIVTSLPITKPIYLDWSPYGKTIAFTGRTGSGSNFYLIEDFLSLVKK